MDKKSMMGSQSLPGIMEEKTVKKKGERTRDLTWELK